MNSVAQSLHDYARTLIDKGTTPFSKATRGLRERGGKLVEQIENTMKDISHLAEQTNSKTVRHPRGKEVGSTQAPLWNFLVKKMKASLYDPEH
jgi:hypothetical protein